MEGNNINPHYIGYAISAFDIKYCALYTKNLGYIHGILQCIAICKPDDISLVISTAK